MFSNETWFACIWCGRAPMNILQRKTLATIGGMSEFF